jgi:hypothetical protein
MSSRTPLMMCNADNASMQSKRTHSRYTQREHASVGDAAAKRPGSSSCTNLKTLQTSSEEALR